MEAFSNIGTIVTLSDKPDLNSKDPYMYLIIGGVILTVDFQYIPDDVQGKSNNSGTKLAMGLGTPTPRIGAFNVMTTASSRPLLSKRYYRPGVSTGTAINDAYRILSQIYYNTKSKLDSEALKYQIKQHICNNT